MSTADPFADLPTPALILDRARLVANTRRMSERARAAGVALRPHMKTAKSIDVARLATAGHDGRITVSTLAEAEHFAAAGFRDITWAVCCVPAKLDRAAAIQRDHGARVHLITDDAATARGLGERAAALGARFSVLVEIDSGEHRTGVPAGSPRIVEVARAVHAAEALDLDGVLTHGGHAYACRDVAAVADVAEEERRAVVDAAAALRAAGLPCATVSAGSTPTAVHARSFDGLTEIRPGVYVFFDLAQAGRRSCAPDDVALTVLATVIAHNREAGRLIVDAGGLALSKDTSAGEFLDDAGYGWIADPATAARIGDLRVAVADQEHGYVEGSAIPWERLAIGSRVRILPNHACMTAAAHDRYHVLDGDAIVATWPRVNRW